MLLGIGPLGRYALSQFPDFIAAFFVDTEIICVPWEDRAMSARSENREMRVESEYAAMAVRLELRAMAAGPRKRAC